MAKNPDPLIIDYIKDVDKYFDPKLFIHLLEVKFSCNIFLFTRAQLAHIL